MKKLLGRRGLRMLDMITYLYHKDWVTLQELSKATHYNERTLREDIKYLNVHLAPICIESSKKTGIRLLIPVKYSLKYIYSMLMSESIEFTILEAIFFNTYDSSEELADELYSSSHVVNKAIKHINQVIKKLNFQIALSPIKLVGDEKNITIFYISYLRAKYENNLPLDKELIRNVNSASVQMYKALDAFVPPMNRNILSLYSTVRVHRLKQDNANRYDHSELSDQPAALEFNRKLSALAELSESYDFFSDIYRPSEEHFLCFSLEELLSLAETSPRLKQDLDNYRQLMNRIEKELNINFTSKEDAIFRLYNISLTEAYNLPMIENHNKFLLNQIKQSIPYVYLIVSKIVKEFSDICQISYASLLYYTLSSTEDFYTIARTSQPKLKVALYGHYNHLITINNFNILKTAFEHQFDVTLVDSIFEDTPEELNDSYDLVITEINDIEIETDCFCIPFDICAEEMTMLHDYYYDTLTKMAAEQVTLSSI
ncbi:helix-turn-helix domain-containing protein [Vagococcus sp. BWB3-3]|uniref:Helix-turn-helix domain-containing protein n=1 Tax=Vagococcus allomyrinae TaxID=2794353 RepID=A0A940P256_9ENTE|nr:helix-turn-helix domain-containing protein [Vagococcus allomyrinae]MBP1040087.1 helix-turn-helix domain-containing protein [Vagococcus allomyrinae]